MKPRAPLTEEQRARISAGTKAAMASPEIRAMISERTKAGMVAASGQQLAELRLLHDAWQRVRPAIRIRFFNEIFASACSASAIADVDGADDRIT